MKARILAVAAVLAASAGCMPRVTVKPNPGPDTPGIRYYRPKPYLLITPFGESLTTYDGNKNPQIKITGQSDQYVQMELQMLPDFSEEYAINIHSGFGTNDTTITLEDGWNLTHLNAKLDSQTDENIKAVSELISAVGSAAVKVADARGDGDVKIPQKPVVRATNVPLGYYESVIGRDACGKKRLYGWRYVGFAPFNGCPLDLCGSQPAPCDAIELYGLVFECGVMTFRPIHCIQELGPMHNCRYCETVGEAPCPLPPCAEPCLTTTGY